MKPLKEVISDGVYRVYMVYELVYEFSQDIHRKNALLVNGRYMAKQSERDFFYGV